MTYAIEADLRARHGAAEIARLADEDEDDDGTGGRIEAALVDASSEIDAALARAWDLPLPDDDYSLLRSICCDLARQRLHDDAPPDAVRDGAESARERLDALAAGTRELIGARHGVIARRPVLKTRPGPTAAAILARLR